MLTAIDQRINTLHLALNNATSRDSIATLLLRPSAKTMSEASIRDKIQDQVDAEATVANRYAFVSPKKKALIGSGSFAKTWKMKNKEDGRIYAVKQTDVQSAQQHGLAIEDLREEAARLQMLHHPNIVRYYEAFKFEDIDGFEHFAIVMELLNGGSLHERLKRERGPLTSDARRAVSTAKWARQVASALAHMHTRRMQHRDLKPDNVVFDEYGDARVIDLGLAVVVKAKAAVSSAGGANKVGAEAYRSPEKADGKRYDGKDDVWALGCMLGGAVTGKLAEDRCSGRALTRTATKALVDETKAASAKFGGLVAAMLELNPTARPTAQAVELLLLRGELLPTSSGCATIVEEEEAIAPVKPSTKRPNGAQTQECGVCGTRKDYQKRQRRTLEGQECEAHCTFVPDVSSQVRCAAVSPRTGGESCPRRTKQEAVRAPRELPGADAGRALRARRRVAAVFCDDVRRACRRLPDGRRVVSGSGDKTLKVWDVAGRMPATLEGHSDNVRCGVHCAL